MISINQAVYCVSCKNEIPHDDCVEIYGDIWLPGVPYQDFELYFHTDCLPEVFHPYAKKALGNDGT
jgi:hypothetical protein